MESGLQNVFEAAKDLWQGRRLPVSADLDLAVAALSATDPIKRIAGSAILLISKSNRVAIGEIAEVLKELSLLVSQIPTEHHFWLTSTIVMLPEEILLRDDCLRRFIYMAVFSQSSSSRCNATLMLDRLAKKGDRVSRKLLQIAVMDEDSNVASNARSSLEGLENDKAE